MQLDALRAYLLTKAGAGEDFPFGPDPLVLKVGGKMFALVSLSASPLVVSLKCDPAESEMLRDTYPAIKPGYHLDKRHWVTVTLDGSLPEGLLESLIDDSYRLVFKGLTKAARAEIEGSG